MITFTIRVKLILKAFGYTAAILVGAYILATIIWIVTGNPDLGTYAFWGGLFLGILAVLTDALQKREAPVMQQWQEEQAVAAPSHTPVVAEYGLGTHQVRTATIVDLNLGIFDLHLTKCTDSERSKSVPSHLHQIIQD